MISASWLALWGLFFVQSLMVGIAFFLKITRTRAWPFLILFMLWYWLVMVSGIPIAAALDYWFGFLRTDLDALVVAQIYSALFLLTFLASYLSSRRSIKIKLRSGVCRNAQVLAAYLLISASFLSLIGYLIANGGFVLLAGESYAHRYEANAGLGLFSKLIPLFIPGLVMLFVLDPSKRRWALLFTVGAFLGVLSYVVIGGYRQILAIFTMTFVLLAYHFGYVRFRVVAILGMAMLPLLAWLALVRYGLMVERGDAIFQFLVLTYDSFSPFDSFAHIVRYFEDKPYAGLSPLINEFIAIVPRAMWADKPDVVMNAGNYYTRDILSYDTGVTISPTIGGSLFLIGGVSTLLVGAIVVGRMMRMMDINFRPHIQFIKPLDIAIYYTLMFNLYALVREGIEVFIVRTGIFFMIVTVAVALSQLVLTASKFRNEVQM